MVIQKPLLLGLADQFNIQLGSNDFIPFQLSLAILISSIICNLYSEPIPEKEKCSSQVLLSMDSSSTSSPFCAPHATDLAFTTRGPGMKSGQLAAFNINGDAVFRAELTVSSNKQFLVDAMSGSRLLTLKSKVTSLLPSKISSCIQGEIQG